MCPPDDPSKGVDGGLTHVSDLKPDCCYDIVAEVCYAMRQSDHLIQFSFTQLAHRSNDTDRCTDLYVTDYSTNVLPSYLPDRVFKKISDRPIFVIGVFGDRNIVHDLSPGSTYLFKRVKVVLNEYSKIKGRLNYADTNIIKVNSRTKNEDVLLALKMLDE